MNEKKDVYTMIGPLECLTALPENYEKGKKYPVLIWLHGAGSRGNTRGLFDNPLAQDDSLRAKKGFLFFAPHIVEPEHAWFAYFERLYETVKIITERDDVDMTRVCLMGASMGGYGTWEFAKQNPQFFSCIVPICGGGMKWNCYRLTNVPVWAFHGALDTSVDPMETLRMVTEVNKIGGNAKMTLLEKADHDAWNPAFQSRSFMTGCFPSAFPVKRISRKTPSLPIR